MYNAPLLLFSLRPIHIQRGHSNAVVPVPKPITRALTSRRRKGRSVPPSFWAARTMSSTSTEEEEAVEGWSNEEEVVVGGRSCTLAEETLWIATPLAFTCRSNWSSSTGREVDGVTKLKDIQRSSTHQNRKRGTRWKERREMSKNAYEVERDSK